MHEDKARKINTETIQWRKPMRDKQAEANRIEEVYKHSKRLDDNHHIIAKIWMVRTKLSYGQRPGNHSRLQKSSNTVWISSKINAFTRAKKSQRKMPIKRITLLLCVGWNEGIQLEESQISSGQKLEFLW